MKLIQQTQLGECGAACLAMVAECTLDEARGLLHKESKTCGVINSELIEALGLKGVIAIESLVWPSYSVPAILTVPSLNHPGLNHCIVWSGTQYLDPSHESLTYPNDAPIIDGRRLPPQWTTAILLFNNKTEQGEE